MIDRDRAAFRRDLRTRRGYPALVWGYRAIAVVLCAGVPILEVTTGTAREWWTVAFVLGLLGSWTVALAAMVVLLKDEPRLRGRSRYLGVFARTLLTDLFAFEVLKGRLRDHP
ncbi:hypothetical protein Afil01_20750 [Actinorhabdospora filicis]|uniref:Uncharacterized protein n=1 Tax=Actinorhabdospora filicis TaxID=1785913 RepID=A0A9W6SJ88_9ACTN|nr:hypothetical protein Afil01_20750 [Actinorhabdospora filicis]